MRKSLVNSFDLCSCTCGSLLLIISIIKRSYAFFFEETILVMLSLSFFLGSSCFNLLEIILASCF